jgi:hypothetical protein
MQYVGTMFGKEIFISIRIGLIKMGYFFKFTVQIHLHAFI